RRAEDEAGRYPLEAHLGVRASLGYRVHVPLLVFQVAMILLPPGRRAFKRVVAGLAEGPAGALYAADDSSEESHASALSRAIGRPGAARPCRGGADRRGHRRTH